MSKNRDYQPGELVPGTVYQVHRVLGAGGMGTVYDVEDTTIGKRYVLKTLHPQLGDRQDLARRMQNEARALARLQHPNIVEVFTAGVTGDDMRLPFYVMERLSGQTLRFVLQKKGALDLPHAYHIAIDLLDALDHAHDKGIVHRDVKPDNIFLHRTAAGVTVTKLLDFGIMSVLDAGTSETGGRFLGTLRYAAPEQLKGAKPTPKMDLYAAGLVIFEMVTGRGPFDDDEDPAKVAAAHIHREAPLVSRFVQAPEALVSIVRATLAKDPERRPRDAFSLAAQLRTLKKALGGVPGEVPTEHRATAPAVLSGAEMPPSTPPMIHVQQGVVVSPLSPLAMSQHMPPSSPVPKTTVRGMMPPTMSGPTLENAQVTAGSTLASNGVQPAAPGVDRMAPTHSLAIETPRMPQHGTDPLGGTLPLNAMSPQHAEQLAGQAIATPPGAQNGSTLRVAPSTPPPVAMPPPGTMPNATPPSTAPMNWPAERAEARSESGQTRTVPPPGRPMGLLALLAVLVVVAVVVSGLALARVFGDRGPSAAAASASATASAPSAPSAPAQVEPVATNAATSTATASTAPASDSVGSAPSASAPRAKTGTAPMKLPAIAPPTAPTTPLAPPVAPAPPKLDRPGPGF